MPPLIETVTLPVGGMTCASCVGRVERSLSSARGVKAASVNLATEKATITFDRSETSLAAIAAAVEEAGYSLQTNSGNPAGEVSSAGENTATPQEKNEEDLRRSFWTALVFSFPVMLLGMLGMDESILSALPFDGHQLGRILFLLTIPVVVLAVRRFYLPAWKLARHASADMNTLVAVGTGSAFLYSTFVALFPEWMPAHEGVPHLYFDTTATIITLVLMGKMLEARAKRRTADEIRALVTLQPDHARVIRNGQELDLPVRDLAVGDIVVIRPGERLPVDGRVVQGTSAIDESAITGESMPVEKTIDDQVTGGTVNGNGSLEIRATAVGQATVISRIIRLVEEAQGSKAPIQRLADRVAGIFVPIVIAVALLTFVGWMVFGGGMTPALMSFIAVLVIACPCAMGLATPAAIMVGTGRGASLGILIRNAESLERMHRVQTVVFDKTGTLTEGKPSVSEMVILNGYPEEEVRKFAASAESRSEHPLARAIVRWAENAGVTFAPPETFEARPGSGISARVDGRSILVGSIASFLAEGITIESDDTLQRFTNRGQTVIAVAIDGVPAALFALSDRIKANAAAVVSQLHEMGIETVLLTGDNPATAHVIAQQAGIDRVIAGVLPDQKASEVRRIQAAGKIVAMVGDGINDAPALASADVGIAIGSGTDVAMETADITLMKSELSDVFTAISLSRKTIRTIKQNLFWAFFYNIAGIPLAAAGLLNPVIAAGAMAFSSVSVVSNSLRLRHSSL